MNVNPNHYCQPMRGDARRYPDAMTLAQAAEYLNVSTKLVSAVLIKNENAVVTSIVSKEQAQQSSHAPSLSLHDRFIYCGGQNYIPAIYMGAKPEICKGLQAGQAERNHRA